MSSAKNPNLFQLVRWLTSITRPVHKPLLASTLFRLVNLSLDITLFGLAGGGVVAIVTGHAHTSLILALLVVIAVLKAVAYYLEQLTGHYVAFKALELLRTAVFAQLWPKAPGIVAHSRSGDVLTSLTRDVDRIEVVYAHTFAPVVSAYIVPTAAILVTGAVVGWGIVVIPAACIALALLVVPFVGLRRSMNATHNTLELRRDLSHHLSDSVFGTEEVVGYGRQEERVDQSDQLSATISHSAATARTANAFRRGANTLLMLVSLVGVAACCAQGGQTAVLTAALTAGTLRLFEGPRGVEDAAGYLDHSLTAARRLWDMSHAPAAVGDGPEEYAPNTAPAITWENISFAYETSEGGAAAFALDNVSIHVPPRGHAVLVGPSGSGKTTTIHMLLRYADPTSGRVLLDGVPISRYTLDSLRRAVVVVAQKNQLLDATIGENIRLGAPTASDDEVWNALRLAGLDEEIRQMPDALATPVGQNGSRLSGGQAQRLCLARALLMKPRVLVLDEFTANLNTALEARIRENLARAMPELTIVEVTHRLESVGDVDQVIVLDRGRVVNVRTGS
ncbi:ABC transporter ATP-binding protein [Actinobaculum sp. 352]|uniref:amino acid ABC transporter ATP-binding/permease protein n=1 Tax=Actinobaculum sp. 352 TaxID=2490946 RepID=UPI000F7D622A|nr:ABC transporter ATP-binding protein [Actinobaculum sp. 352]RTE47818.1 ABC transporter ATP-binding protein [Actinobaculum sp. 352]